MARGGRTVPKNPASYSGVGKNSKRTDGRIQPRRAPRIQEGTDLTQGEGEIIRRGQQVAPLSKSPTPNVNVGASPPGASPTQGGSIPPEFLFGMPGPENPMPMQEPQDEIEIVLMGLAQVTGDPEIARDASEYREFKAWKTTRAQQQQAPPMRPEPTMQEPEAPVEEPMAEEPTAPVVEEGGDPVVGVGVLPEAAGGDEAMDGGPA